MVKIRENGATSGIGVLATYGYDDLGRRTSLTFGNGESASYQYDAVSRLSQLSRDLGGSATTNDLTLTFAYNPASQIVSTTRSNPGSGPGQADLYAWTGHGSGSTSTTANGLNQIASWNSALSYDARGNMTSDGTRTYTYDSENRLADTSSTIPYYYDPLGRLAGAGAPLAIHYENYVDGLIAERLPNSSGVSFRHVFGPDTDEPIVWYVGPGTSDRRFLHADERGSIVAVTDSSANLLAISRYDEYGQTQTSGTNYGRFLYTGQRYFSASGLYYYKNRFYRPDLGRFMQPDPIGYEAGMNLYAYVGADPVNFTDPLGLAPGDCANGGCEPFTVTGGARQGSAARFGLGSGGRFQLDMPIEDGGGGGLPELLGRLPSPEAAIMCGAAPGSAFSNARLAGLAAAQWERAQQRQAGDIKERSFGLHKLSNGAYTFRHQHIGSREDVPMVGYKGMAGIGHMHTAAGGNNLSRASDLPTNSGFKGDVENIGDLIAAVGGGADFLTILGADDGSVLAWTGPNLERPGTKIGEDRCD